MAQKIQVEAELRDGVSRGLREMANNVQGTDKTFASMAGTVKKLTTAFVGLAAVRKTIAFGKESVELARQQAQAEAALGAAIKSTGGAARLSADELKKMASAMQGISTHGDEAIISAQAIMLTFTQIGRETFPRAIETILDMSDALGQSLKSSAIQLGKALNDPIRGAAALRDVGVSLTAQQVDQIKKLQTQNDMYGAQKVILDELQIEFGGMARALADTDFGKITQMKNELGDIREEIGQRLLPAMKWWNQSVLDAFNHWSKLFGLIESDATKTAKALEKIGQTKEIVAGIKALETGIHALETTSMGAVRIMDDLGNMWDIHDIDTAKTTVAELRKELQGLAGVGGGGGGGGAGVPIKNDTSAEDLAKLEKQKETELALHWKFEKSVVDVTKENGEAEAQAHWEKREAKKAAQQQEFEDKLKYQMDIDKINADAADYAIRQMAREEAARQQKLDNMRQFAGAAESMANDAVSLGLATKEQMKPILTAAAIADGAAAAVAGLRAVWNTAASAGPAGAYVGAALSAAVLGQVGLSTAVQVKKIQSAATGADFIAHEPQLMLVGDNPGSQGERVQVTPNGSNNLNGPQGGGGGATININITGGQSPQATGRELAKAIKMLHVQGLL